MVFIDGYFQGKIKELCKNSFLVKKLFYNYDKHLSDFVDFEDLTLDLMRYRYAQIKRQFVGCGFDFDFNKALHRDKFYLEGLDVGEYDYYNEFLDLYNKLELLYGGNCKKSSKEYKAEEKNRYYYLFMLLCFLGVYRHSKRIEEVRELEHYLYYLNVEENKIIKTHYNNLAELLKDYEDGQKVDEDSLIIFNEYIKNIYTYKEKREKDEIFKGFRYDLYKWALSYGWVIERQKNELELLHDNYITKMRKEKEEKQRLERQRKFFDLYQVDIRSIKEQDRKDFLDLVEKRKKEEKQLKNLLDILEL